MLEYMKDEGQDKGSQLSSASGGKTSSEQTAKPKQDDQNTGASSVENAEKKEFSQDYLVPSSSGKKVKYSTIILGVVFLIGAVSLFFMIKKIGPYEAQAGPSQEELKIESAIQKLSGSKAAITVKMNDIVDRISNVTDIEQVSVDDLKKNPFAQDNSFAGVDIEALAKQESASKKLKLWSIMECENQMRCMINGRAYRIGDQVGNYRVKNIFNSYVELDTGQDILVLRMSK